MWPHKMNIKNGVTSVAPFLFECLFSASFYVVTYEYALLATD